MPLLEHILELRRRLTVSVIAIVVAMIAMWFLFNPVWDFLKQPYCDLPQEHRIATNNNNCTLFVTGIFEGFNIRLKVTFILGLVVSSPVWLYQIWAFIVPALRRHERKWTFAFLGCAVPLFLLGAALAYYTLNKGLAFLLGVNAHDVTALITVSSYLGFLLAMLLIFGVSFEFPLVVVLLNFMGVLSYARLRSWWRGMVLGIFIFAAVATPSADPLTMTALAVPMCLLYWLAAGVAKVHDSRKAKREAEASFPGLSDDEASPLGAAY
ncbi:MAG: sec-independent protein translocase protein TatC [Frankiales bacterium]|nr:sec-independent protein translocase protein TatC [Frankiales bacterium]